MNEWFIKLFRSLLDWEWYDDINTKVLFIHLLLKANYKTRKWRWIEIKKWENLTSLSLLSQETWLTIKQIRLCLKKLKGTQEIEVNSTTSYSIIKLNNYDKFNWEDTQQDKPKTQQGQTEDKQRATKEERKNIKKERNKESKHKYWEYSHILLLDSEKDKFIKDFWKNEFDKYIKILDEWIELKWYKYKSHYLAMRKWKNWDSKKNKNSFEEPWETNFTEWL